MIETKFKKSEVGLIPEDWEDIEVGHIANLIQTGPFGSQLHQSDYITVGIPVVMPKDLVDGRISDTSIARVSKENVERLKRHKIKEGDFLFARRGDVGRCALTSKKEVGWLCGTGCFRVSIDKKKCDINYLYYQLQRKETVEWIVSKAIGSTMLNLNTSILSQIPFIQPESIAEQSRIAEALSDIDDLISTTKKLIEKKRNIKEGAMQDLLSGKRRIKKFETDKKLKQTSIGFIPCNWEIDKIGEQFEFLPNNTLPREEMSDNGVVQNIHYGDVLIKFGSIVDVQKDDVPYISNPNFKPNYLIIDGDVIIADTAEDETVGKAAEITNVADNKIVSGLHTMWLHPINKGRYGLGFLGYAFNARIYHNQLLPLMQGTKVTSISKTAIQDTYLVVPPKPEQEAIVSTLSAMDEEIQSLEVRLTKYQSLKQGMMQQLLTGKIRLI